MFILCYNCIGDYMKIDKIKKSNSGKYKVYVGDKTITTYDDVLIKTGILYKKDIDEDTLDDITKENNFYDAYNKTLAYIMKHQRCKKEIKEYIKRFELSNEEEVKIIKKLEELNLINEVNYVKSYIYDSVNLSNYGPHKIKNYLLDMDISEDIINEELDNIDENEIYSNAVKIISKKVKGNHHHSEYQMKQKISMEMINLGYSKDMIDDILNNLSFDDNDFLEKEYDKLYSKLSKKYNDNELFQKIKQKLYAKGFDINNINSLINKKKNG